MGRKAAPQPLALGVPLRPGDDSRLGETVPGSARLPPDSATPRSPRSPFRYGQTKPETADVLHHPQKSPLEHQEDYRQTQKQNQQQQQQQQQYPDAARDPRDPPLPSPRSHSADHQQQQLGRKHQRRGDDKASKSGFFFNFGKTAKPADRPIVHQQQQQQQQHQLSNSRAEVMSRDSDRLALSKQSTKHSGRQNIYPLRVCCFLLCSAFGAVWNFRPLSIPQENGAFAPASPNLVSSCANNVGPES